MTRFESLIRGLDGAGGVADLVAALGFETRLRQLDASDWLGGEAVRDAGVETLVELADRPGFAVLMIELAEPIGRSRMTRLARRIRAADPLREHLLFFVDSGKRTVVPAVFGLEGELRHLTVERGVSRRTDAETLADMVTQPSDGAVTIIARCAAALDRSRVTTRFFVDFRAQRSRVAAAWTGVPPTARSDRGQLALLFLCRLMFLCFLQRGGHLCGDEGYLFHLFQRWRRRCRRGRTFFRSRLDALFFGALNRKPGLRHGPARRLGDLPYLNGGLFEPTPLERRCPALDLDDAVTAGVFDDLLLRYRFDARDAAGAGVDGSDSVDIDPEMLGRVFEGVMAADRRGDTGTFFTPARAVDRLVRATLDAHFESNGRGTARSIADIRVLDPACGSGAFLLAALSHLTAIRCERGERDRAAVRRDIVGRCLHGVDIQADAALLCSLRLWLALTVSDSAADVIQPLPNLDRRIRQGDALVDPLDALTASGRRQGRLQRASGDPAVREAARALAPLSSRYVHVEPAERSALQRRLLAGEATLARAWLAAIDTRLHHSIGEARALAGRRDLWGEAPPDAAAQARSAERLESERRQLKRLARRVDDSASLPFFSFSVHFAHAVPGGFDLVLMNPPWVRSGRWPPPLRGLARSRYAVCREPGWPVGTSLTGTPAAAGAQVDMAHLFVERSLDLLAERGTLGALVPSKTFRSLYGGAVRSLLVRETAVYRVEDYSLDHRGVFAADAFAAAIVATRVTERDPIEHEPGPESDTNCRTVRIRLHHRSAAPLEFAVRQSSLPLIPGDGRAPWLLAPPDAVMAFRRMQRAGAFLGERFRVRRGVFTGANDVLLVPDAAPRIAGLAWIRAQGALRRRRRRGPGRSAYEALVESAALAPVLKGAGVEAWRYRTDGYVIWSYDDQGRFQNPPARLAAYLDAHSATLAGRTGRPAAPAALFRVARDTIGHRVVWHDLADTLKAVSVPGSARTPFGRSAPIVPLNTVYFIPVSSRADALLLAGLLNSLPLRCFARSIAERAKDARFRFFAWTVALLPLPPLEPEPRTDRIRTIAASAHEARSITAADQQELDELVADLYQLAPEDRTALRGFDDWLSGRRS